MGGENPKEDMQHFRATEDEALAKRFVLSCNKNTFEKSMYEYVRTRIKLKL